MRLLGDQDAEVPCPAALPFQRSSCLGYFAAPTPSKAEQPGLHTGDRQDLPADPDVSAG